MKFTLNSSLRKALKIISPEKDAAYPVVLTIKQGGIILKTLEGFRYIEISLNADTIEEGEAIIAVRHLRYMMQDEEITFTKQKESLVAKSTGCVYRIPFYSGQVESFKKPEPKNLGSATFELKDIQSLLKKVIYAIGDEKDTCFDYNSVLLECESDSIVAVGCDKRVMAVSKLKKGSPYRGSFTLHKSGVFSLLKLEGDIVTMTFYEGAIGFSVSGEIMTEIFMPESSAHSPNYKENINLKGKTLIEGDKETFLSVFQKMNDLSPEVAVRMWHNSDYIKQNVQISARDKDGAQIESVLPLKWDGEDLKLKINAKTFLRAVEQTEKSVLASFMNDSSRFLIKDETDNYFAVLVPYSPAERR